jgi:hypothetical protein
VGIDFTSIVISKKGCKMRLLSGASLREAITRIASGENISLAVAFWVEVPMV